MSLRARMFGAVRRTASGRSGDDQFDESFLRQLELLSVVSRRLLRGRQRGERKTRKVGSGLEFADHREYSAGDDIRNVDWNIQARLGQTLVRLFDEDEDLPLRLVVDVSDSMATREAGKLIYAQKIAAALAYVGLAGLDRVGLSCMSRAVHETLPAVRGKGRIFRVFEFLRQAPRGGPTDLRAGCARVAAESAQAGVTVVISDFYDLDGAFDGLNLLRFRQHQVVCVQVLDPVEADPRQSGLRGDVNLRDCEGSEAFEVTLKPSVLDAYHDAHERFCQTLGRAGTGPRIPYFRARIDDPFEDVVLRMFRAGGVLR
ncbi:MAG: DUF58 domain-containing protein [Myxococcales bacterium FL481]|nr:MAG: DUF58 domain-containing protein [Myxococcales bacterium FL481]